MVGVKTDIQIYCSECDNVMMPEEIICTRCLRKKIEDLQAEELKKLLINILTKK